MPQGAHSQASLRVEFTAARCATRCGARQPSAEQRCRLRCCSCARGTRKRLTRSCGWCATAVPHARYAVRCDVRCTLDGGMDAPQSMRGTSDVLLYAGRCMMPFVQLAAAETAQLRQLVDAALAEVAALSAQVCRLSARRRRSVYRCYLYTSLVGRSRQPARF